MRQIQFRRNTRAALLAAIAAAYPVTGYSAPAARVDFAVGNVTAVTANGQSRALAKGAQLDEGETINTNNGRAQLRFTDGAYVSLQPESAFRIDQYRFEGKQDGSERTFLSLLKGGLRTITGVVGRSNRKNYQVSTTAATIGIRGTEYTIQYGGSISGTVGEGEIEVCNGQGCLAVTNGESYYVQNQDARPVLSNKRTDLPPPPPQNPPPSFAEGEHVDQNRRPLFDYPSFACLSVSLRGVYRHVQRRHCACPLAAHQRVSEPACRCEHRARRNRDTRLPAAGWSCMTDSFSGNSRARDYHVRAVLQRRHYHLGPVDERQAGRQAGWVWRPCRRPVHVA